MYETACALRYLASRDVFKSSADLGFRHTHFSSETSVNSDSEPAGAYPRQDPQRQSSQDSRHTGQLDHPSGDPIHHLASRLGPH